MIQIKHKDTGEVLHEVDSDTLVGADLSGVDLSGADLSETNLRRADLSGACLSGANLCGADLRGAILCAATLSRIDFSGADLTEACLARASLRGANLSGAVLERANLSGADLSETVLDPSNPANHGVISNSEDMSHGFEVDPETGMLIGYRTKSSVVVDSFNSYEIGKEYEAPWFSTCSTECHPGLYVSRSIQDAIDFLRATYYPRKTPLIKVRFAVEDLHRAGNKFRVRKFTVIEKITRNNS